MTAEIAIMNKEAIALAADSAVTLKQEREQKIFTSANKLFALSKRYPLGIMVYGNASFMGIPWETIIKTYRKNLGEKYFNTTKEYADDFISFLDNGNQLFPETQQKKYFQASIFGYFTYQIKENIKSRVASTIKTQGKISESQIEQIVAAVIEEQNNKLEKLKTLPSLPEEYTNSIINKYKDIIDKVIKKVFEELPISASLDQLRNISGCLFSKDKFPAVISGVVIAGFGEKDTFPSLRSFDVEGIVNNKLKYKKRFSEGINFEKSAAIIPFAQQEMVYAFMEGIEPHLQQMERNYLFQVFNKYPETIIESTKKFHGNEKKQLIEKLTKISNQIFKDYQDWLKSYRTQTYVSKVLRVVGGLPKDELATMAESLVRLTSFKRRVTMESETVGEPIDVAVISKGDGFIWIKRKHYFKEELNPQFFDNYYRR